MTSETAWKLDRYGYPIPDRTTTGRDGESYGQRITRENNETIAKGRHPVTGQPLLDPGWGYTCRDCAHCFANRRNRTYWKCELNATGGPRTDIRVSWPACTRFRIEVER